MCRVFAIAFVIAAGCQANNANTITCPKTNPPTYQSFGQNFFATFCTPCHSATSPDRNMAPSNINFDTEAEILENADDINMNAGYGPEGPNRFMPYMPGPVTTPPTDDQRKTLAEFLACEEAEP